MHVCLVVCCTQRPASVRCFSLPSWYIFRLDLQAAPASLRRLASWSLKKACVISSGCSTVNYHQPLFTRLANCVPPCPRGFKTILGTGGQTLQLQFVEYRITSMTLSGYQDSSKLKVSFLLFYVIGQTIIFLPCGFFFLSFFLFFLA